MADLLHDQILRSHNRGLSPDRVGCKRLNSDALCCLVEVFGLSLLVVNQLLCCVLYLSLQKIVYHW